jgi:polysaccharide export outer membrane protein
MGVRLCLVVFGFALTGLSQNPQQQRRAVPLLTEEFLTNRPANVPTSLVGEEYRIGRDDLIDISVFEIPDLASTGRVSASGIISLPLIGPIQAAGKTTQELEKSVEESLKARWVNDPKVTVFVREYASQPVSIIGAVKLPGIYQMKGQKFLLDMLASAQGIDQSVAGNTIQVIRRRGEAAEGGQTITVSAEDLFQNGKTELNIPIEAGDIINVVYAGSIFVIGEVIRPGEFVLRNGKPITAAQAIALGSGFTKEAKKKAVTIIRIHRDSSREEIPVNIEKILDGSIEDVRLMPDDILFVPANKIKTGLLKALDTTVSVVSGRLIYRF